MNFVKQIIKFFIFKFKFSNVSIGRSVFISMDTKISKFVTIEEFSKLASCNVGSYSYIGSGSSFSHTEIGSFCSIGKEVLCGLGRHPIEFVSTYPGFYSNKASGSYWFGTNFPDFIEESKTFIGADVWIGARAIILGGVSIGTGAIIAAGAVVTKDIPPFAIVGGVPAKILKYRFDENLREKILESRWWEFNIKNLRKMARSVNDPHMFLNIFTKIEP